MLSVEKALADPQESRPVGSAGEEDDAAMGQVAKKTTQIWLRVRSLV